MAKQETKRAKHSETSFTDTESVSIIKRIMAKHKGVAAQLDDHNTWPNTDGRVEVLGIDSRPIGLISAQVKKLPENHGLKFDCPVELFDYVIETADPILLLCVDTETDVVYWQYYDKEAVKKLIYKRTQKTLRVELREDLSFSRDNQVYIERWRKIVNDRRARMEGLEDTVTNHLQGIIDVSKQLLGKHRYTEALEYLEALKDSQWDEADDAARYRIQTNLAAAQCQIGQADEAAKNFLEAFELQPELLLAKTNKAFAYMLKGEFKKALAEADKVLSDHPINSQAVAIKIQAMSLLGHEYSATEKVADDKTRKIPEVAHALGSAAERAGLKAEAKKLYETAAKKDDDPQTLASLGTCLLSEVIGDEPSAFRLMLTPEQKDQTRRAMELLKQAWASIPDSRDRAHKTEWLFNAMTACRFIDEDCDAETAIEELLSLKPDNEMYIKNAAINAFEAGKFSIAEAYINQQLERDEQKLPELRLILADVHMAQNKVEDALKETRKFLSSYKEHDDLWINANQNIFDIYIRQSQLDDAEKFAKTLSSETESAALGFLCLARLARIKQDTENFSSLLEQAEISLPSKPEKKLLIDIAHEAYKAELYSLASRTFERLGGKFSSNNPLSQRYLNSLFESGQYEKSIAVAKGIREVSGVSRDVTQFEWASYLELQDLPNARKILSTYVKEFPDDESAKLSIALIDTRQGKFRQVDDYLNSTVDLAKLEFHSLIQLANLHQMRGNPKRTLEIIYEARRRYPDNPDAHSAYISLFFGLESLERDKTLDSDTVSPNSVLIYDEGFFLIEADYEPQVSKGEISPEDAKQRGFLGKKVGDKIELTRNHLAGAKEVVIKEIKSKYVHALHESMQNYERLFPNRTDIMGFKVDGENFDPLFKQLDQTKAQGEKTEQLYKDGKITIDLFAKLVNRDLLDVFYALRGTPDLGVKVSGGTPKEVQVSQELLNELPEAVFVADLTALITLFELGLRPKDLGIQKLIVAQSTIDLMTQRVVKEQAYGKKERATLYKGENGKYIHQEITEDQQEQNLKHLKKLEAWIKANTKTEGITQKQLDAILNSSSDPKRLDDLILRAQLDSIRLAHGDGRILYSDDFALRSLAANTFGTKGIWTQMLLANRHDKGLITKDDYEEATIGLVDANYHHTAISPEILLRTVKLSNGLPRGSFLKILQTVARAETSVESMANVLANFLYDYYREPFVLDRSNLIQVLLNEATRHHDTKEFLRLFQIAVRTRFKLSPINEKEISDTVQLWRELRGQ